MRTHPKSLTILTLLFVLLCSAWLPAQRVKNGHTVKNIYLSKKAAAYMLKMPVLSEIAVIKGNVLYPKKGYKLVALRKGSALGIVPDFFQPGKYSTEKGTLVKGKIKGVGLCMCADGGGNCRLRPSAREFDRQGRPVYNCIGSCACQKALVVPDIKGLLEPAKVENPEGTNEWPYGSGIGG